MDAFRFGSRVPNCYGQKGHSVCIKPATDYLVARPFKCTVATTTLPELKATDLSSSALAAFASSLQTPTSTVSDAAGLSPDALFVHFDARTHDVPGNIKPSYEFYPRLDGQMYIHGVNSMYELPASEDPEAILPSTNAILRLQHVAAHVSAPLAVCSLLFVIHGVFVKKMYSVVGSMFFVAVIIINTVWFYVGFAEWAHYRSTGLLHAVHDGW